MTSFGINNKGSLIFDYYHEDYDNEDAGSHNSTLDQTDVYNGKDSVLWVNFAEAFASEIQQTYGAWRSGSDPLLSYDKIIETFITNHSDQWSISIYNEDAEYKYISMYRNGEPKGDENLYQVRGTGEEHLKYFVKNRLMYCDSKWKTGDFVNKDTNTIIMRINSPEVSDPDLTPSSLIKYKTFSNMYAGVGYGAKSGVSHHKYVERGKEVSFIDNETSGQNDLDTYIFGANEISSLDDLSRLYCGAINVSAASKLTKLTIGNENKNYKNNLLTTLSLSNNRLLRELNICNCTALQGTIDLSLCPDIQKIYAKGSGISGVQLPTSGFLKEITLPATISNLAITKQKRITRFECEGYGNITTLKIDDSTMAIEQEDGTMQSTDRFPLQEILLGCNIDNLVSVSITNTKWDVGSEEVLRTIITKLSQKQGFVLEGSVYLLNGVTVSDDLKVLIHQKFPNLNVIDNDPIFYVDYYNYDNTLWDTETVRAGNNAQGPAKGSPEDIIQDEQGLRHLFVEWENLPTNVQQNCRVGAKWQTKYAVTFYNYDNSKIGDPLWYNANEKPEDPIVLGAMNTPVRPSDSADLRYVFNGWDGLPDKIDGPVNVYATFVNQYPVRFYNGSTLYDEQWIISGDDAVQPAANPEKASTAEFSYSFLGWDGKFTDITGPTKVYATYRASTRSYPVYFHYYDGSSEQVYNAGKIAYNNTATYRGDTPVKQLSTSDIQHDYTSADYEWTGKWSPEPIPKTGNITKVNNEESVHCYPVFRFKKVHEDDWDTIAYNVQTMSDEDLFQRYPIGTRKDVSFTIGEKTYNSVVEIIAHNHDNLADGSGKAKLTFFTNELPDITSKMGSTTDIGWGCGDSSDTSSNLRLFLQTDLFNGLPDKLKAAIKPVKKKYNNGYDPAVNIVESIDTCWLASDKELGLITYNADGTIAGSLSYAFIDGQGEMYSSTFSDNKSRLRFVSGTASANTVPYWTRSAYKPKDGAKTHMFWHVNASGGCNGTSSGTHYIAFGFCI